MYCLLYLKTCRFLLLCALDSGSAPVVRLTQVYRQAQGSDIIKNARRINHGDFPLLHNGKKSDFFFIEQEDASKIPDLICELCSKRLPRHYGVDPIGGIQVLTPMQRGETGAANLNQCMQKAMNPNRLGLRRGGTEYRVGDKVMQIRNNYQKETFNGDIGFVTAVDAEDRTLKVSYDGVDVGYDNSELDELILAYATSIHKAQGSAYPIVVMPFTMQHFKMLQRNLLYTGVTRAKKVFVLVGSKKAVGYAIGNNTAIMRNTGLKDRLL